MMKAFIDLDCGYDTSSPLLVPGLPDEDVVVVSRYDAGRQRSPEVKVGDVFAFLNGCTEPFSAYLCKPASSPIPASCGQNQIVCAGIQSKKADGIVGSLQKLSMRACVARSIDSRGIMDCSRVLASSEFWERLFLVHARWYKNRMCDVDANYPEMLINFCASLYEYEPVVHQG